jgi:hypothetical protein
MKLNELAVVSPTKQAAKVFESYFGNSIRFDQITPAQARGMLKRVRTLIAEHRRTPEFHSSEHNPSYLKLVMMEQALATQAVAPAGTAPAAGSAAMDPTKQAGLMAAQVQEKKKQIQDTIKAKQEEIAQLQKQMNDPTMMAMTEAMPTPDAQIDPQATNQYAQKIKQALQKTTNAKIVDVGNRDGTVKIVINPDPNDRNPPSRGYVVPDGKLGATIQNINAAIDPYENMFRSKGWRFDQMAGGMFTIGVPKSQQPAVAEGRRARRLREASEIQQAQVVLASQDMVDQVQKMSEQISAMQFKDLPALVDQIKNEVGVEQSTQYNADASAALSGLLQNLQGAKQQLEAALGVVTGQAPQVPGAGMAPAPAPKMPAELPAPGEEEVVDTETEVEPVAGLGRERR